MNETLNQLNNEIEQHEQNISDLESLKGDVRYISDTVSKHGIISTIQQQIDEQEALKFQKIEEARELDPDINA